MPSQQSCTTPRKCALTPSPNSRAGVLDSKSEVIVHKTKREAMGKKAKNWHLKWIPAVEEKLAQQAGQCRVQCCGALPCFRYEASALPY